MRNRLLPVLLACALLAATGCDSMKSSWKSTRKLYKEYVNVDPTIDLKDTGVSDPSVKKLAALFAPVDERLEYLTRTLSAQDAPPKREWCESLMNAYPWITSVAVLNSSGVVGIKLPSFSLKQIDYAPMMDFQNIYKQRKMAAHIDAGDLGSEVLIAQPLFADNEFQGVLVVSFDPAALAKFSPEPDKLMILAPKTALWSGADSGAAQALTQQNWKKLLAEEVTGEIRLGSAMYLWQARWVAHIQLIYAVEGVAPQGKAKPAPAPATKPEPAPAPAQ